MTTAGSAGGIYPDSGYRLPLPRRDDLGSEDEKFVYDQLLSPGGGSLAGLQGPGGIRLHSPRSAIHSSRLAHYLRYESGFSGQTRELAILVAAREMDNQFEWAAHEPAARREGVPDDLIGIVKHRRPAGDLPELERVVIEFGRQLFREKRVSPGLFARARALFGDRQLVDLVSLFGMYAMTAILLDAFDIQLPADTTARLPLPGGDGG